MVAYRWSPCVAIALAGCLAVAADQGPPNLDPVTSLAPDPSLAYVAKRTAMNHYLFLNWRLEMGDFGAVGAASRPDLAVAFGGDHSVGPLVVFKDVVDSSKVPHDAEDLPGWTAPHHAYSQVHFADVDPRCPGAELIASRYGTLADRKGGLEVWYADKRCLARPASTPLLLGRAVTMDFDVADVEGDGTPELAVAVKYKLSSDKTKANIIEDRMRLLIGTDLPDWIPAIRLATLDDEVVPDELGYIVAATKTGSSPTRATTSKLRSHEVFGTRFFDVDGDAELELLFQVTGRSLVVVDWKTASKALESTQVAPACPSTGAGSFWCDSVEGTVVGIEPAVVGDETVIVTAVDCHRSHDGGDCVGHLRVHRFARTSSDVIAAIDVDTPEVANYPGKDLLTGLKLVHGPTGGLLAVVSHARLDPLTHDPLPGGLAAYDFASKQWSDLIIGEGPSLVMDIEALPSSVAPTLATETVEDRRRVTLPGAGPHRIVAVRSGRAGTNGCELDATPLLPCNDGSATVCWEHERRSHSVLLHSDAAPSCWEVRYEQHPMPVLAVADAWPRRGSGLWFLYPPEYDSNP